MLDKLETEKVFRRLFNGGLIRRMPKSNKDSRVFVALAASIFNPGSTYTETEVNDHLVEWMSEFTCPIAMDHVTLRRYMVDYRFLLRDSHGAAYTTNQTLINNAIAPEARSVHPKFILEEVEAERKLRKRAAT